MTTSATTAGRRATGRRRARTLQTGPSGLASEQPLRQAWWLALALTPTLLLALLQLQPLLQPWQPMEALERRRSSSNSKLACCPTLLLLGLLLPLLLLLECPLLMPQEASSLQACLPPPFLLQQGSPTLPQACPQVTLPLAILPLQGPLLATRPLAMPLPLRRRSPLQ